MVCGVMHDSKVALVLARPPAHHRSRANPRILERPRLLAIEGVDRRFCLHVAEPRHEHLAADNAAVGDDVLPRGDDRLPRGRFLPWNHLDDARVGSLVIRHQKEAVAGLQHPHVRLHVVDERREIDARHAQVVDQDIFAGGGNAVRDVDDQPVVVFADVHADQIEFAELLAAIFAAEDLGVIRDRGAEFVEPHIGSLMGEARVVETGVVRIQADAGVARRWQDVGIFLAGAHVQDVDGFLVGAAHAHAVDEQIPFVGDIDDADVGVLVGAQPGRVNEPLILGCPACAHIDRRLVFFGESLREEVFPAMQRRHGVAIDPLQGRQLAHNLRTVGDL
jgi:hypothetical protein